MIIETTLGTMTAEAWHTGKHVALEPSGFNWRVAGGDIDILIDVFENRRNYVCVDNRLKIIIQPIPNGVEIISSDPASHECPIGKTRITDNGVRQLIEVLKSVQFRSDLSQWTNC